MTHDSSDIGTIDHLPECIHPQQDFPCAWCQEIDCECPCICDRLRACEQRVEESMDRAWTQTMQLAEAHARVTAYAAGVQAARDAVAAVTPIDQRVDDNGLISLVYDKGEALAAIDALKEKP